MKGFAAAHRRKNKVLEPYVVLREEISQLQAPQTYGVGYDVSFDLALIHEFGAEVFAFDPTPSSVAWAQENVD